MRPVVADNARSRHARGHPLPRAEDLRWENIRPLGQDGGIGPVVSDRRQQVMSWLAFQLQRALIPRRTQRSLYVLAGAVLLLLGVRWLATPLQQAATQMMADLNRNVVVDRGFQIRHVEVGGHVHLSAAQVVAALELNVDSFSLQYDVAAARSRLLAMGWIADARITMVPPDGLRVDIVERQPTWVLKHEGKYQLIAADGARIEPITKRADWPHLPLLVGEGAEARVAEAYELLHAAAPLGEVVGALVRVGQRRWDLHLGSTRVIMLPEDQPVAALNAVVRLEREQGLMKRDFKWLDVRNPHMPTLRLHSKAGGDGA